jgi:hypothetical protein
MKLSNNLLNKPWVIEEIRKEIEKFLDSNKNKRTIYQSLWNKAKAILRGNFIAISGHIRKLVRSQVSNLMMDKGGERPTQWKL